MHTLTVLSDSLHIALRQVEEIFGALFAEEPIEWARIGAFQVHPPAPHFIPAVEKTMAKGVSERAVLAMSYGALRPLRLTRPIVRRMLPCG